jgi:hypothetical protein
MSGKTEQYLLDQLVMINHLEEYGMYYEFISMGKLWELTSVAYSDLDNDSYLRDLKEQVHDN